MLKTAGLILIIIGSLGGSLWNASYQKQRLYINESILDFIIYIKHRIHFFHESLDEVYSSYENEYLQKRGFLTAITDTGFNRALTQSGIDECFDKKTVSVLRNFGKKLGKTGIEEQIANCNSCIEQLQFSLEKLRKETPERIKMYSSLSIIGGLGISLLLI